jgi:transcriptional regulator HilA, main transcriptional regulator of SPI1
MGRPRVSDGISSQHPSPAPLSGSTEGSVVSVFGPFCLEGGVLRHGDDPLRLTPKEAGLLTALSEASGGIVPVPALLDRVWGDEPVGIESLNRCISTLRANLARLTPEPVIETLHRRGYRLVPAVRHFGRDHTGTLRPLGATPHRGAEDLFRQALQLLGRRTPAEFALALSRLEQAAGVDPNYLPAISAIADVHISIAMRRYDMPRHAGAQAVRAAESVLARFPESGAPLAVLGFAQAVIDGRPEGLELLDRAVRLGPEAWLVRFYRGWTRAGHGAFAQAIADFEEALRLSPMDPGLAAPFGYVLLCAGETDRALRFLHEAVKALPLTTTVHGVLAIVASVAERHEDAIAHAEQAMLLGESSPIFGPVLAYALARAGRVEAGAAQLDSLLARDGLGPPPALLAPAEFALGRPERARVALTRAEEEGCPYRHLARFDPRLAGLDEARL